jgi:metal-responsive CopG/Arc/MetJ family transcriptional regulator
MPDDLLAEVDDLVGPRKRSEFFVEAVREKLRRARLQAAAEAAAGSLVGVDIPGWETSESAAEWVHNLRRQSDRRLDELGWGTPTIADTSEDTGAA